MDHDGTKNGFAVEALKALNEKLPCPLIASGGGGRIEHFRSLFEESAVDAALAASIFHFKEVPIPELKNELERCKIPVRN
jgi:cyclase